MRARKLKICGQNSHSRPEQKQQMWGFWQYLSPWFIFLAQGSWCPHWAAACHSPFPVRGRTQIFHPANVFIPFCLVCLCQLTGIPHVTLEMQQREGETLWARSQHSMNPNSDLAEPTAAWLQGFVEDEMVLVKIIYAFCLFFDLNWLSLNQKQRHVWLSQRFLRTFSRVQFDIFNILTNINLWSTHT